jgi:hypothetical protein
VKVTDADDLALVESWLERVIVDYHMHLRDSEERIAHTVERGRAVRRDGARARLSTRSAFTRARLLLPPDLSVWTEAYQTSDWSTRPRRLSRGGGRGTKRRGLPVKRSVS